jgi:hypothetical protein
MEVPFSILPVDYCPFPGISPGTGSEIVADYCKDNRIPFFIKVQIVNINQFLFCFIISYKRLIIRT